MVYVRTHAQGIWSRYKYGFHPSALSNHGSHYMDVSCAIWRVWWMKGKYFRNCLCITTYSSESHRNYTNTNLRDYLIVVHFLVVIWSQGNYLREQSLFRILSALIVLCIKLSCSKKGKVTCLLRKQALQLVDKTQLDWVMKGYINRLIFL